MTVYDVLMALVLVIFLPFSFLNSRTRNYTLSRMRTWKICQAISQRKNKNVIFYCSSIGEFEQAIPLITMFESEKKRVILFFHSKKGYNYCKKMSDYEAYLTPFDLCCNWMMILHKIKPEFFIINRNEFWPGALMVAFTCSNLYLVNFVAKLEMKALEKFAIYLSKKVFIVNDRKFSNKKISLTGDTRLDRLVQRYETNRQIIEDLRIRTVPVAGQNLVVMGNAYPADLKVLMESRSLLQKFKFLVIPARDEFSAMKFPSIPIVNSPALIDWNKNDVVMLDVIGILFELYGCANIAWIGGGFDRGIHNCTEAYFFNIPLISGPSLNQQPDALQYHAENKLLIFNDAKSLENVLSRITPQNPNAQFTETYSPTKHIYSILHEDNYSGQKELKPCA